MPCKNFHRLPIQACEAFAGDDRLNFDDFVKDCQRTPVDLPVRSIYLLFMFCFNHTHDKKLKTPMYRHTTETLSVLYDK